eukprot:339889_1
MMKATLVFVFTIFIASIHAEWYELCDSDYECQAKFGSEAFQCLTDGLAMNYTLSNQLPKSCTYDSNCTSDFECDHGFLCDTRISLCFDGGCTADLDCGVSGGSVCTDVAYFSYYIGACQNVEQTSEDQEDPPEDIEDPEDAPEDIEDPEEEFSSGAIAGLALIGWFLCIICVGWFNKKRNRKISDEKDKRKNALKERHKYDRTPQEQARWTHWSTGLLLLPTHINQPICPIMLDVINN